MAKQSIFSNICSKNDHNVCFKLRQSQQEVFRLTGSKGTTEQIFLLGDSKQRRIVDFSRR
jgi:hypothetical protein